MAEPVPIPISGTVEIKGILYPFTGVYGAQDGGSPARLAWSAQADGLGIARLHGLVALPGGHHGASESAVAFFVQDHFQGRMRLHDFESRNGVAA